ncbi:MAG: accessory gene regulator B family protein [Firmicutes bacterium]|nr:accessory gene regulator B family protein [Bacillota bacterium]
MFLRTLAARWAERLHSSAGHPDPDPYRRALTAYALEGYLALIYSILVLCLAGWLVGAFRETVIAAAAAAVLKTFAGGAHLSTPTRCAFAGAALFAGLGYLAAHFPGNRGEAVFLSLLILANLLVWLRAPVEAPGKPLTEKQRTVLGVLARLVIGLQTLAWFLLPPRSWLRAMVLGSTMASLGLSEHLRRFLEVFDRALTEARARLRCDRKEG